MRCFTLFFFFFSTINNLLFQNQISCCIGLLTQVLQAFIEDNYYLQQLAGVKKIYSIVFISVDNLLPTVV